MSNDRFQIEPPVTANQPRKRGWGCFWVTAGIGCLTMLLLVCGGVVMFAFMGIKFAMTVSEPYQRAVQSAKENAEVRQIIGEDVQATPISGSISERNGRGEVDIELTVSGNKGKGKIHVRGNKTDGSWTYDKMIFTDEQGTQIDLDPGKDSK